MEERKYVLQIREPDGTIDEISGLTIEEYEFLSEKALQDGFEVLEVLV